MPDLALDLRYLRYAIVAAESGSFRQAAVALNVSQSTVSRRIQLLEHRLGFFLFHRDRKGVHLTPHGRKFLKEAATGVDQLQRAIQVTSARHRGEHGELNVGIFASLVAENIHLVLKEFRQRHQRVKVTLHELTVRDNIHRMANGGLDAVFLSGELDAPGYISERLWRQSVYIVLPSGHSLTQTPNLSWRDIRNETFIVTNHGCGREAADYLVRRLSSAGFRPRIETHDVSREILMDLVSIGYGLTVTGASATGTPAQGLEFRPAPDDRETVYTSLAWSKCNQNPTLTRFIKIAKEVAYRCSRHATSVLIAFAAAPELIDVCSGVYEFLQWGLGSASLLERLAEPAC